MLSSNIAPLHTMRRLIVSAFLAAFALNAMAQPTVSPRERASFNAGWLFQKGDPVNAGDRLAYKNLKSALLASSAGFLQPESSGSVVLPDSLGSEIANTRPDYDDKEWRALSLPHDWGIEGPFKQEYEGETGKLPWWGIGWYRKHFAIPALDKDTQFFLDVDGAMSHAAVWCNGHFVGGWPYGYASFRLDLTPHLKAGTDNVIAIRLDNPPKSSRWYPGGGIYRNVWLVKTSKVHVAQWGVVVTTPRVAKDEATVELKVAVDNQSGAKRKVTANTAILELGPDGATNPPVAASDSILQDAGPRASFSFAIPIKNPKLWNVESPHLYVAVTTLKDGDVVLDRTETVFGIRTIQFTTDHGFLLNGKRVRIQGVCDHHDLGALGAAINSRAIQRQLEILKEMGVNAIRTSHNPPAPELLNFCDRMGFVVMDEAFDCWRAGKTPNGYNTLFDDWSERDMRALVRRDRNHPSVVLWSVGNEILEQSKPTGSKVAEALVKIAHEEDPTRPATAACDRIPSGYNGFQKCFDVFGYNYKPGEYQKFAEANPAIPLFGSETASTISSRGEYFFPLSDGKDAGKADFQMSSYDLYAPPWATTPDREFQGQDQNPRVIGEFVWTGFDYLGEPTPYSTDSTNLLNYQTAEAKEQAAQELKALGKIRVPSRSSYFGIIDLAGFKKDRFYLYQAHWRPDLPMAHLLPHWTWPGREGQVTPVHVYTSGDEAELFLNGISLGKKKKQAFEYRLRWDEVKYQPGELRVVAYKAGRKWAEDAVTTAGPAAKVTMTADREKIRADGQDLAFVTITIADKDGRLAPRAKNSVKIEISGPGELIATDNGDATDHTLFQSNQRKAFNGLALAVVRSTPGNPGAIVVRVTSEGLNGTSLQIAASP